MSLYFILYLLISSLILISWILFYSNNKKSVHWFFFLTFIFSIFIWLSVYLISFSTTFNEVYLLYYSRFLYWLDIFIIFSIIFFFNFYKSRNYKYIFLMLIPLLILLISTFSPYVVKNMIYDPNKKIFFENYWLLYYLYLFIFIISIPALSLTLYKKLKKLKSFIDKMRLKILFSWLAILIILETIFLAILPIFWIRLFEKEQILFFIPFIASIWYTTYRYNFIDITVLVWRILNFLFALFSSILSLKIIEFYFLNTNSNVINFWSIEKWIWNANLILWIILFSISYQLFKYYVIWNNEYYYLNKKISLLKKKIAFISSINDLNEFLKTEFVSIFNTNFVNIKIINKNEKVQWLEEYFSRNIFKQVFINEQVFIEENKNKFNYEKIKQEISKKSCMIFPLIDNKWRLIWIFEIWKKLFWDLYTKEEADLLKDFASFLVWHLKYIEIYSKINELNTNLDRKIDEKTIAYNTLINKQNDFIAMASHEIKSPLWSCIFQLDWIIDDLKEWSLKKQDILKELEILNKQLIKVWDLTKRIFLTQKYDLDKIELFIQDIELNYLLEDKIEIFKRLNPNIDFIKDISLDIWYFKIDKIQFEQVIDNLINNAIKFCNENPKIFISAHIKNNFLIIEVHDNWKWFKKEELKIIFDKYWTWESTSIWLWMWLYLCKKIVELHKWNIKASKSKILWGAKFEIKIPKN